MQQSEVLERARARPRLAVLHPERARRLGERPDRDLARPARPELRARLGLRDRLARGRRRRGDHPPRRRRRRAGRRHRGLHAPADPRRLLRDARARRRGRASAARLPSLRRDASRVRHGRGRLRARCSRTSKRREKRGAKIYAEVLGYGASNDAYHMAAPDPASVGVAEMMRAALARARVNPIERRLRERARNVDAAGRPRRDEGAQGRLRRPRVRARRLVDEVDDGPLLRGGRRDRVDDVRARDPRGHDPADDQLRAPGSRVRPRLRPERGAPGQGRRRALECDGPRRPQRLRACSVASTGSLPAAMAFIVDERVEEYAVEHTTVLHDLFERLDAETREKTTAPQMMVGRIEGGFLATLVRLSGAKRILELGTFTGYSSISMASRAPPTTAGSSPATSTRTRRRSRAATWTRAGTETRSRSVSARRSRRSKTLEGPFDLVFIDADKPNYEATTKPSCRFWPTTASSSRTTSSGRGGSSKPTATSRPRRSRPSTSTSAKDPRVVSVMLTVRDGMTLVQKR